MGLAVAKSVCVCVPCFNEEENVRPLYEAVASVFETKLPAYDLHIQFIDNCSTDGTREILRSICERDPRVRAIFNSRNYRSKSALYGMLQAHEDCLVYLSADFQDPPEMIPQLIEKWEDGALIVAATKVATHDNPIKAWARNVYYRLMTTFSRVGFIEQFCNFGVYDKRFMDTLRSLRSPYYSIRGNVAEFGYDIARVPYEQPPRAHGKSNFNVWSLTNLAIDNFVNYTDVILRIATVAGLLLSLVFFLVGVVFLVLKLVNWSAFPNGIAPILIGVFFIGSVQTFLIGIIGEYVLSVKEKVNDAPLVIERERINFTSDDQPS